MTSTLRGRLRTALLVSAPLVPALAITLLVACDQPTPRCNVAHGPFWAKYTLVSGEGACAMLTGEQLDVQSYYAPRSKTDKRPDYDAVSIAIQPSTIGAALANAAGLAEPDPDDTAYALGRIVTTRPEADGFCRAPSLSAARLRLPSVPEHAVDMCTTAPEAPAYDIQYELSNVRIYYTPAAIGTQFEADLTYTQDDCVARYKVSAVFPAISCAATQTTETPDTGEPDTSDAGAEDSDAGMAPATEAECPPPAADEPAPTADDSLCENPELNPDFAVRCDPVQLMCVLAKAAPSLK
jgi:hypothetical protein